MCGLFSKFLKKRKEKRLLKDVASEMAKNLEACFVMQQLGQLRLFELDSWEKACSAFDVSWPPEVLPYTQQLKGYNTALKEAQEYENWYAVDIARQNQESAKILHDRKEMAQEKFTDLERVIKSAQVTFKDFFNL